MSTHKLQPVRGTKDLFGDEILSFNNIVNTAKQSAQRFSFEELQTPIFEFSEIFERNLGETSDIVSKEVYKFPDRGGNNLTLRPEFTASIVRAFASNGSLMQVLPKKFFLLVQFFVTIVRKRVVKDNFIRLIFEVFGEENIFCDVETILLATSILKDLGILQKTSLQINSLGCAKTKEDYEIALKEYFAKFSDKLSADSKKRLEKNPLRILDSKELEDIELLGDAPKISDFYSSEAKERFDEILKLLTKFGVNYEVNERLVRGLDYYTSTVFEFTMPFEGAQNTVLAGGRYDDLVEKMSGKKIAAIGFAAGIERLMLLLEKTPEKTRPIAVNYISENEKICAFEIAQKLRDAGFEIEFLLQGNFKKQMKRATQNNCRFVVIIGEDEMKNNQVLVKDFDSSKEQKLKQELLVHYLEGKI